MGSKRCILVNGTSYEVEVLSLTRDLAKFVLDGRTYEVQCEASVPQASTRKSALAPSTSQQNLADASKAFPKKSVLGGIQAITQTHIPRAPAEVSTQGAASTGLQIRAPLCGVVIEVCVGHNMEVQPGSILLRIEAMKMENNIFSPTCGKIIAVSVQPGDEVKDGQVLLEIEALPSVVVGN